MYLHPITRLHPHGNWCRDTANERVRHDKSMTVWLHLTCEHSNDKASIYIKAWFRVSSSWGLYRKKTQPRSIQMEVQGCQDGMHIVFEQDNMTCSTATRMCKSRLCFFFMHARVRKFTSVTPLRRCTTDLPVIWSSEHMQLVPARPLPDNAWYILLKCC